MARAQDKILMRQISLFCVSELERAENPVAAQAGPRAVIERAWLNWPAPSGPARDRRPYLYATAPCG